MIDTAAPKPELKQKSIRTYVIRGGRITSAQKQAFDRCWPTYGLSLQHGLLEPEAVFKRSAPLVVEIGFGMGDSLLQMAQVEPEKDFIGIEVHPPGVGRLINSAAKEELNNIRVYMADAVDVINECFRDGAIDRLQIFFPDPWHKKKHHKRRLIQPQFVQQMTPKIKIGGILHLATDWQPYAEHMLEVLEANDNLRNRGAGGFCERPGYRPITKFEQRGARLGHGVWDLLYVRV